MIGRRDGNAITAAARPGRQGEGMADGHLRRVRAEDCREICGIYNYYVENTVISFEEQVISEEEMSGRIARIVAAYPWIVYELEGRVVGYAYLSRWKERPAYRFTAEDTVYVHSDCIGKGIGKALLGGMFEAVQERDIHVIMSVIALPNESSVGLHERFGFRKVAHFSQVGFKHGRWIDVGYWELQTGDRVQPHTLSD
jgi:L-amino acid N-acyltransferase YncA